MEEWYHTIWGILLLGAAGSIFGALFLKFTALLLSKLGPKMIVRLSTNLLMAFAENRNFIILCEKNGRSELITLKYTMAMSKYTRIQIIFVVTVGVAVSIISAYFSGYKISIVAPILIILMSLKDLFNFIKYYLGVSGCLPEDVKKFGIEIENIKKKDSFQFIEDAIKSYDS